MSIKIGGILDTRYVEAGLTVEMPDDHVLELKAQDEVVARFSQIGATREAINDVAQQYVEGCLQEPEETEVDWESAKQREVQVVLHLRSAAKVLFEICPRCGKPTVYHEGGTCSA